MQVSRLSKIAVILALSISALSAQQSNNSDAHKRALEVLRQKMKETNGQTAAPSAPSVETVSAPVAVTAAAAPQVVSKVASDSKERTLAEIKRLTDSGKISAREAADYRADLDKALKTGVPAEVAKVQASLALASIRQDISVSPAQAVAVTTPAVIAKPAKVVQPDASISIDPQERERVQQAQREHDRQVSRAIQAATPPSDSAANERARLQQEALKALRKPESSATSSVSAPVAASAAASASAPTAPEQVDPAVIRDLEKKALAIAAQRKKETEMAAKVVAKPTPETSMPTPKVEPKPEVQKRTKEIVERQNKEVEASLKKSAASQPVATAAAAAPVSSPATVDAAYQKELEKKALLLVEEKKRTELTAARNAEKTAQAANAPEVKQVAPGVTFTPKQPAVATPVAPKAEVVVAAPVVAPKAAIAVTPPVAPAPAVDAEAEARAIKSLEETARKMALERQKPSATASVTATVPAANTAAPAPVEKKAVVTTKKSSSPVAGLALVPDGPRTKQQKLADILELYRADKLTPTEYHEQRAKILAEP